MHAISQFEGGFPDWQAGAEQRLRLSMALSAVVLAAILSVVRLPSPATITPLLELVVELTWPEPLVEPEPEVLPPPSVIEPAEDPVQEVVDPGPVAEPARQQETSGDGEPVEWDVERDKAIKEVLDAAEREASYSVNPVFEAARREASVRFRASLAPGERHIWDNVEKDQLGRTILRDGNCFRVLDDPSGVNNWAFENFDQHIVYCEFAFGGKKGRELPWVEIIRERYPYLRNPVVLPDE